MFDAAVSILEHALDRDGAADRLELVRREGQTMPSSAIVLEALAIIVR